MGTSRAFGGKPLIFRGAITTAGRDVLLRAATIELHISTDADLRVYFNKQNFTDDENYFVVKAAESPFQMAIETRELWLKGNAATANVNIITAMK